MEGARDPEDAVQSFRARLNALYSEVRAPTYTQLRAHAAHLGLKLATSTTGTLLTGSGRPRWDTVETFVLACRRHATTRRLPVGSDEFDLATWRDHYERLRPPGKATVLPRRESYAAVIDAFEHQYLARLRDRDRELGELADLILSAPGYAVIEGGVQAGKTALCTALRRRLLASNCAVIIFFVVRGSDDTESAFLAKVITQLLEIGERVDTRLAGESVSETIDGRRTQFISLWEHLTKLLDRPLVLLVDGLNEQRDSGIGHLLPITLGTRGRVVVSSRPEPTYRSAVPAHHPLADLPQERVYRLSPARADHHDRTARSNSTPASSAQRTPMRDLLYLSETKMRVLVPQLPNTSASQVAIQTEVPFSFVPLLDAVIRMIDIERTPRRPNDPQLRAGDWMRFNEQFRYGEALPTPIFPEAAHELVYFLAGQLHSTMFVLCGSRAHLLDKRQTPRPKRSGGAGFYTTALLDYARHVTMLPDEAALTDPPALEGIRGRHGRHHHDVKMVKRDLAYGIRSLYQPTLLWAGQAVLSGHARVLALDDTYLLATPLYVEYEHHR